MRNSVMRAAIAALFVWGALSGCSDDSGTGPDNNQKTPPALPSVSTMKPALDFYGVEAPTLDGQSLATGKPSDALLRSAPGDHSNWINAYVRAVFITLATYYVLDVPIAAFAIAVHSVPQAQDDGSYLWTYIFVDNEIEHSVFLYGTPGDETVAWRMEVSSNNPALPLDHFVWFDGESRRDDTGGYWQFYQPVGETDGTETIRIDWTKAGRHEGTLELTVNGSGLENEGDTLTFTGMKHASSIEYYDASEDFRSQILWRANGTGSITVPDYNEGQPACWDPQQINVACD